LCCGKPGPHSTGKNESTAKLPQDLTIKISLGKAGNFTDEARLVDADLHSFREAEIRTLNRAATRTRTYARNLLAKKYNITVGAIDEKMSIDRARQAKAESAVKARGTKIDLVNFGSTQGPQGVTVEVIRGSRKLLRNPRNKKLSSFFATPKSGSNAGKRGIYTRQTAKRFPIRRYFGPSIPQLFGSKAIKAALDDFVASILPEIFHEEFTKGSS